MTKDTEKTVDCLVGFSRLEVMLEDLRSSMNKVSHNASFLYSMSSVTDEEDSLTYQMVQDAVLAVGKLQRVVQREKDMAGFNYGKTLIN